MIRLVLILAGLATAAVTAWYASRPTADEIAFGRDDTEHLAEDALGLRDAYVTLRSEGHKVALQPPDREVAPEDTELAWWILQAGPDWFENAGTHTRTVKEFVERGGTVVLMPEEAVTPIPGEEGELEAAAMLDGFFARLGLDLRIVAFSPQEEEDEEDEGPGDGDAPPAGAYNLAVSGDGEPFTKLGTIATSWGNYFDGESLLKADIRLHSDGFPLIAEFHLGKGRLVLVAESTYFENEFIERAENKRLLLALATQYAGRGIHFHPTH